MVGAVVRLPLILHFVWDVVDLGVFVWWTAAYSEHISDTDSLSLYAICIPIAVVGTIILFRGFVNIVCNGMAFQTLKSIWESYENTKLTEGEFYLKIYKEVAQHLYLELLFDLVQAATTMWFMARLSFNEKDFNLKVLIDFANISSTVIDAFLFKGPEAIDITGCNLGEMVRALLGILPTYRALAAGAPPPVDGSSTTLHPKDPREASDSVL